MRKNEKTLFDFIRSFIFPVLIGKTGVMYFGLNYSQFPGEGYGYGLVACLLITIFSLARLIYKYRNVEDL